MRRRLKEREGDAHMWYVDVHSGRGCLLHGLYTKAMMVKILWCKSPPAVKAASLMWAQIPLALLCLGWWAPSSPTKLPSPVSLMSTDMWAALLPRSMSPKMIPSRRSKLLENHLQLFWFARMKLFLFFFIRSKSINYDFRSIQNSILVRGSIIADLKGAADGQKFHPNKIHGQKTPRGQHIRLPNERCNRHPKTNSVPA